MTRLRQAIARRLKDAQNTAAMLTTFNEVDMSAVMALRNEYKDGFEKKHGVKLGFMSFFVKAALAALKELPAVNAEIYGDEIDRSEERRAGKGWVSTCRYEWWRDQLKQKGTKVEYNTTVTET